MPMTEVGDMVGERCAALPLVTVDAREVLLSLRPTGHDGRCRSTKGRICAAGSSPLPIASPSTRNHHECLQRAQLILNCEPARTSRRHHAVPERVGPVRPPHHPQNSRSDPIDAHAAARAILAGEATVLLKDGTALSETSKVLVRLV
ncbi:hypothetical protein [Dactylosporangium darangshiense]|uniref:hypothetical protein n=1 Tax=Dactylosporangium darangshiense TaxID=579108 RepID=UPI0031EAC5BE